MPVLFAHYMTIQVDAIRSDEVLGDGASHAAATDALDDVEIDDGEIVTEGVANDAPLLVIKGGERTG